MTVDYIERHHLKEEKSIFLFSFGSFSFSLSSYIIRLIAGVCITCEFVLNANEL
jgi:hypothetical protein